ncbi:hypothetical protein N7466_008153 [Penicillium verhagenii]|uniref:uncharacterized protein n=1 Tax=Penicillium verhagenii TaxID=1562060 RepID=UPI0025458A0F|nr:uncharacterized protein N7466_008153 [Penicillium verhagenii]KAJ5923966.1 hypothetical protein N7466_008153 [Penicillium verhagenii]
MVKTTYALTLFTAVSLAAPLGQTGSGGSGNLIGAGSAGGQVNDVLNGLFKELTPQPKGEKQARSFTGDLSKLPILGDLFGGDQNYGQNYGQNFGQNHGQNAGQNAHQNEGQNHGQNHGQNYGQNAGQNHGQNAGQNAHQNAGQNDGQNYGQNYGQNHGQNEGQNYAQNHKRDLDSDLASLPIVGKFLGDATIPGPPNSHHQTRQFKAPSSIADFVDPFSEEGLAQTLPGSAAHDTANTFRDGLNTAMGLIPLPVAARDVNTDVTEPTADSPSQVMAELAQPRPAAPKKANTDDKADAPKKGNADDKADGANKANKPNKPAKPSNPLADLASKAGLGQLFGHAQHGVGLLPMNGRRDNTIEARGGAPIQGSTLTDVLLQGGALGKISHMLAPGAPVAKPGQSDSKDMGDGSSMAPPGQPGSPAGSIAAGPHDGPGYAAEHAKQN